MSQSSEHDSNSENKKRHTDTVEEKLEDLHISEPELKRRKEMQQGELPVQENLINAPKFVGALRPEEKCSNPSPQLHGATKPFTASCGHSYCSNCIENAKRLNVEKFNCTGKDEESPSGVCGVEVQIADLAADRALDKQINKKMVYCTNQGLGCEVQVKLRNLQQHLATECNFSMVPCPKCKRDFQRGQLKKHSSECQSEACSFSSIGCENVSEPAGISSSFPTTPRHNLGVHLALLYQELATLKATAEFSASTLDLVMNKHSHSISCQEQCLNMASHPDEQRVAGMSINELRTNFQHKASDAKQTLDKYNRYVHVEYPTRVAEPVLRQRNRSQWLEYQEEDRSEFMSKFMQETLEVPILLNQGSMIFKLTNFSEKRMKAIKGEVKRGIYGPPFYTHEYGYLMVPIVYPNGDGAGNGTHLSIFIAIKKGKFDALLRWPVVGRVTISILSQRRVGRETVRHSFKTDVASLSYHRPAGDMNQASGIPRALALDLLKQPSDFLVDDTLFIQLVVEPQLGDK